MIGESPFPAIGPRSAVYDDTGLDHAFHIISGWVTRRNKDRFPQCRQTLAQKIPRRVIDVGLEIQRW